MADVSVETPEFFEERGSRSAPASQKAARRNERKAEKADKQFKRNPKPLSPLNARQEEYIKSIEENDLTFATGPAGVGKTYVPSYIFGGMLASGKIEKIYVARPNISKAKHRNGFLPGTLEEKTAPWLIPIFEAIKESMGPREFARFKYEKKIEEVPFEFMQGRTFKNAAFIVDEAENLDLDDLYITLTRLGEGCMAVFCGDIYQSRIPDSGLATTVKMAGHKDMESVGIIEFTTDEIVRSRQAKQWAMAFRAHWGQNGLHNVSNCDTDESNKFREAPPKFLKEA